MKRREFLKSVSALGLAPAISSCFSANALDAGGLPQFGNITLMHLTDCHAQLNPVYYREPSINLGLHGRKGLPPHLVGKEFLKFFSIRPGSADAYAFTYLNFAEAARIYGKMGGFAYLATLIKQIRAARGAENCLLLDGGDSWQGSATSLWTQGRDMVGASNLLGVDAMTGHWEFTYGSERVKENLDLFNGEFIAHNLTLTEEAQFESDAENDQVFKPYIVKEFSKARVAVIGQAFPYTPIANPKRFIPNWQFGIQEEALQRLVDRIRERNEADVVVLLSHNGMDVDLKMAGRITGIDVILGGHTHDAIPKPVIVDNSSGKTVVTNAGSHGKFIAVLDLDVDKGRLRDFRYTLMPVFSNLIEPDPAMREYINRMREPYREQLRKTLTVTEQLLYRRDNFIGSFDQLIIDALRRVNQSQIAFSPGFRWGTALLPGQEITVEDVMNHTAITYPETYVREMSGKEIKAILEDVCDNLFNPDPYYQQGGDMIRVGGMRFRCDPNARMGSRIDAMRLDDGEPIRAEKKYTVTGWATVGDKALGRPIWDVVFDYLADRKSLKLNKINRPELANINGNPGLESL